MAQYPRLLVAASWCLVLAAALPASLVEDVKDNEYRTFKVKRAHDSNLLEKTPNVPPFYSKPIKRGFSDTAPRADPYYQGYGNPEGFYSNGVSYSPADFPDDGYVEKAFKHAENQAKLDEALRDAILKSEVYGEPAINANQYRYYSDEQKKRRRRSAQKLKYQRFKRDADMNPEEVLAILSLLDKEAQRNPSRFGNFDYGPSSSSYPSAAYAPEDEDETWLDGPVLPRVVTHKTLKDYYHERPQVLGKFAQFNADGYEAKAKRFKVAKRRLNPTRELRYLSGPPTNDYYTLAQMMNNQRRAMM